MKGKIVLFPYYLTLKIRNSLYDNKLLKSYSPTIPTVGIGNVNVGGTGKTPLTDYIVDYLEKSRKVAILSRGYKSSNRKFKEVEATDTAKEVGDEPLQLKSHHPDSLVAIDRNKTRGLKTLEQLDDERRPDIIVIDDVLQHRKITPTKTIVTIDYSNPIFEDDLLPLGTLRDLPEQIRRADAIVITKCPDYLDEWEREKILKANHIGKKTPVFFSTLSYGNSKAVFPDKGDNRYIYSKEALAVTGIAKSKPLIMSLTDRYDRVYHIKYRDHHNFSRLNIKKVSRFARKHLTAAIVTTEKDAQRLKTNKFLKKACDIQARIFYIPVSLRFLTLEEDAAFKKIISE